MTSASDARRWIPASLLPLALITAGLFHVDAQSPPAGGPVGHTPDSQPKLVVMLVIDQFRADYADQYGKAWAGGLHDLMTKGAYFTDAAYPYGTTKTCVGHATIGTGTLPTTHGMVDNEWFDPTTREFVTCTEDPTSRALAFGGETGTEHHSARRMLVPTLADESAQRNASRCSKRAGAS